MSDDTLPLRQRLNLATDYDRKLRESWAGEWASTLEHGSLVLDAGAGDGHLRSVFPNQRYVGLDIAPRPSKEPLFCADLHHLCLAKDSVDHIISLEVFEHLREPAVAFKELAAALKPGGTMCISVPQGGGEHEQPYDFFRYTQFSLAKLANDAGLEVDQILMKGGYFRRLSSEVRDLPFVVLPESGEYKAPRLAAVARAGLVATFTIGAATALTWMDRFDKVRTYTTGYFCVFKKPRR